MDSSLNTQIIILIILIGFSAFFSASETALTTVNKIKIRKLKEEGNSNAILVHKLLEQPKDLIGAILIGNNIVNIGASSIATLLTATLIKDTMFENSGVALSTVVMTMLILIFGEVTPKTFAQQYSEKLSLFVAKPIYLIVLVLRPFAKVFSKTSSFFIRLSGGDPDKVDPFITEEELKLLVDVSEEEGVIETAEKDMLKKVFDFGDRQVKDVMVQRVDIEGIDKNISYNELIESIKTHQYSRIPVFDKNLDNIIGILNIKDLFLGGNFNIESFNVQQLLRNPIVTFENKKIMELLNDMRTKKCHIAIVTDEYGGTAGIVTIEDLLEEIVGEIDDEYDELTQSIRKLSEDEIEILGNTRIEDINKELNLDIDTTQYDSVGGFVIEKLNAIPNVNDMFEYNNLSFIVTKINKQSIKVVTIKINKNIK